MDGAALDAHDLGRRAYAHAYGRRGDMRHVESRSEALMLLREGVFDRREGRRLDEADHHRRGEDADAPAADARRRVLLADDELGYALQTGRKVEDQRHWSRPFGG